MSIVVLCLAAALPVAACGTGSPAADGTVPPSPATGTASPKHTTTPAGSTTALSPPPTLTGPHTLKKDDTGATLKLSVGESATVSLPAEYDPPRATGSALTKGAATGGFPTGRPVEASFTAARPGRAELMSATDYACLHATPRCGTAQQLWRIHVLVVA
ncbi:MAG: hypothetical protein HOV67_28110 [Kribbellaceae bacterium]|nr:hypothetical protein [Kribbellaceae bacterium]